MRLALLLAAAVLTAGPALASPAGVVPVEKWLNAEKGTTVSLAMLTAEPVEVLPRPEFANEFDARLRATSVATLLAVAAEAAFKTVVPATACVSCVPLAEPPEVLTYKDFKVSGNCQNSGATSITT